MKKKWIAILLTTTLAGTIIFGCGSSSKEGSAGSTEGTGNSTEEEPVELLIAAAASLESQQVDYEDLIDLTMGSDRYAREMIMYRLETHRLDREGR